MTIDHEEWSPEARLRWITAWLETDPDYRIGIGLLDLRRRVEAGEAGAEAAKDWWGFFWRNFPGRTKPEANSLMNLAHMDRLLAEIDSGMHRP